MTKGGLLGAHLIPGGHHHDGRERRHVEEHDAHGDRIDSLGESGVRVIGLCDRRAHHLNTNEGEERDLEATQEAGESVGEEAAVAPQVRDGCGRPFLVDRAHGDHTEADDDQGDDRNDLDEREPKLRLTESLDRHRVEGEKQQGRSGDGDPRGQVRPPEVRVAGDGDHVRDAGDNPTRPVRPPGHEARPRADQVARNVREGRVLTIRQEQLAERAHEQEQDSADDHVDQQDRRTRDGDRLARTHEQARPDCAADRNQLNMAILQVSLELFAALLTGLVVHDWLAAHSFSFPLVPPTGRVLRGLCVCTEHT